MLYGSLLSIYILNGALLWREPPDQLCVETGNVSAFRCVVNLCMDMGNASAFSCPVISALRFVMLLRLDCNASALRFVMLLRLQRRCMSPHLYSLKMLCSLVFILVMLRFYIFRLGYGRALAFELRACIHFGNAL